MSISNVFGPIKPLQIAGAKTIKAATMMPSSSDILGGFVFITHIDTLQVSFTADIARCRNPEEVIAIFEKTLD